ncbi:winged helix-turn-helix transcriptional regulator [Chitinophaga barathri]|uniref:Transcriptional regulator n=1 Tax=Chitinophaga barathri TaxID=1647451 RepID=A0A3N4MD82_9BACT|nr:helix-turn-helix domain-containing protein [Chitinophaga barathri]RPD39527.1 transcriptional regulator [Chitinophaga barathri]
MLPVCTNNTYSCKERKLALHDAMDILGGKWKVNILLQLLHYGSLRFKDLQENLAGITPKVLTKDLQELEMNLLVTRTVNKTKPVTVSYTLTAHAHSMWDVINGILEFGILHRKVIKEQ